MLPELRPEQDDASNPGLSGLIAAAADVCRKPLRHAVVLLDADHPDQPIGLADLLDRGDDLSCGSSVEIRKGCVGLIRIWNGLYRSGDDLNLMLGWWDQPDRPLLWQGQHPVWMDGNTGQRCSAPQDAAPLEALTRRLRALLFGYARASEGYSAMSVVAPRLELETRRAYLPRIPVRYFGVAGAQALRRRSSSASSTFS